LELVMARAYNVVDADGHILEPLDLWARYMEPRFRERAPRIVKDDSGTERLIIDERQPDTEQQRGIGRIGALGARQGIVSPDTLEYAEGKPGGFDPHKRIPDMDADGIDAAFLYPSLGLFNGAIQDPELAAAICRAYNRWLADYCSPYPDRLFGIAMLPMQSVDLAIAEMHFARKELGFRGAFLRPNPYNGRTINHPHFEPFWAAAEELDMAIGFHEGASGGMPQVGADRFQGRGTQHIITHPMEMMLACLSVIWLGVCERHPKLRIGFLESGGGWVAGWLDRMDRHFTDKGFNDTGLKTLPSEIFRRNCWISFEPVEGSLRVLADYIGPDKIMWATDYPHPDGFFPGAPDMVRRQIAGLSAETQHQVMAGGALRFYGLQ
jgi:predicted TIM-barrel fold metal-dependent hydrolase